MLLRHATMKDADMLLGWANDPAVRAASFATEQIDTETHHDWLAEKLAGDCAFYIAEERNEPVGYARVDVKRVGDLAVSVDGAQRGRGFGRQIIRFAALAASLELGLDEVHARVKAGNVASLRAFRAAGFTDDGLVWKP